MLSISTAEDELRLLSISETEAVFDFLSIFEAAVFELLLSISETETELDLLSIFEEEAELDFELRGRGRI